MNKDKYEKYYNMINYHCSHILIGNDNINMDEKRKIMLHLFEAGDYLDSNILRAKLFFSYYVGTSLNQDVLDINITSDTILDLGELIHSITKNECLYLS